MLVFVLLVALAAISGTQSHPISHDKKEKVFRYHKECVEETGVEEKLIEDAHTGIYSETPAFKEYTFCLAKKFGALNEAGEFQKETIKNILSKHIDDAAEIEKLIETCTVQKDSPVESAYNSFKCFHDSGSYVDIFYVITISEEKAKLIKKYRSECLAETNVDIQLVENARKKGEFSDDPVFKQFLLCVTKKFGFHSEEGKLQRDIIKVNLTNVIKPSSKAEKLFEECVVEKDTPENTAWSMMKCICEKSHLNVLYDFALPLEKVEKLSALHKECLAETTVDKSLVEAALKGNFTDDAKFREYLFCLSKKIGIQGDDGDIKIEVLRQKLNDVIKDPVESQQLIEKCVVKKDSPQDTAYYIVKCYYENTPKHISILKVIAWIEEKKQKLTKYNNECLTESGLDLEVYEQVKKGIFTENEKFKNHLFCFYKKVGFQNESGEIQKKVLSKKMVKILQDQDLSDRLIEKCAIQKETPQDTAYGAFTCYYENTPTHVNIFARF